MSTELSVILPVYNVKPFLEEAVRSVYNQGAESLEVIAVDDGSDDGSAAILDELSKKHSSLTVIRQENRGLSAARNAGCKAASGRYVYFLDSDDRLKSGSLPAILDRMVANSAEIATFSGRCIDDSDASADCGDKYMKPAIPQPIAGGELFEAMIERNNYSAVISTYLYDRHFLMKHNLQFSEGYIHEDEAYTARALGLAQRVLSFSDVIYFHRIRSNSIMGEERGLKNAEGWIQAAAEILDFTGNARLHTSTRNLMEERAILLTHNAIKVAHNVGDVQFLETIKIKYLETKRFRDAGGRTLLHLKYPLFYNMFNKRWTFR